MGQQNSSSRDSTIEALRIAAAFGIVWYHASISYSPIAYAGLPIFIIITFYFQGIGSRGELGLKGLATRILRPWLVWMIIFTMYNAARHKPPLSTGRIDVPSLLYGSYPHLWYLPFIFVSIISFRALRKYLPDFAIWLLSAVAAAIFFVAVPAWRPVSMAAGAPTAQYAQAVGAIAIGLLFAAARKSSVWWTALAMVAGAAVYAALLPFPGVGAPYAIAIALFGIAVAAAKSVGTIRWVQPIANLTFGIYLVHPPILGILSQGVHLEGFMLVLTAFLLSGLIVFGIRKLTGDYITPR